MRTREKGGSGLTGAQLLERARQRILDSNGGKAPRLLDPFAGGGAIPLEALRLGCEVEASDLNPVAVLILKGTVEYPQKFGQPNSRPVPEYIRDASAKESQKRFGDGDLAVAYQKNPLETDVRYWGNWMLERAREDLGQFYPPDPDGSVPVAYLWSRTIPCPNCGAEMPLIRQYWLARTEKKKVALQPSLDRANNHVDFEVVEGTDVVGDPSAATTAGGDTICLLCRQVVKDTDVRRLAAEGRMGMVLTSVVLEGKNGAGKRYRKDQLDDRRHYQAAADRLSQLQDRPQYELPLIPDEPINRDTLGLRVDAFGLDHWAKLFNARQLVTLATLTQAVRAATAKMRSLGLEEDYLEAVSTYLALAIDRVAGENSSLTRWNPVGPKAQGAMALQALSMVWDYAELNPWAGSVGDAESAIAIVTSAIAFLSGTNDSNSADVFARDATVRSQVHPGLVVTDPPYYNSVDYAGLSDFHYVWLKRSLDSDLHLDLMRLPLTPKREQAIMASESKDPVARARYVGKMRDAFTSCAESLEPAAFVGIVFAHTDPDAWATLIEGLLEAEIVPNASWPLDTEIGTKLSATSQARLKTSVWMACRLRDAEATEAFLGDMMAEMRPVIRERLLYFWSKGIRGADFFISAIGPALSVFGRYARVLRPDGTQVTVRDFLDLVRRESTDVALQQVLHGADLGIVDPVTRQYVTWVWSYSRAPLDAGEAIALCLASGADYHQVVRAGSIAAESREKSKKVVKLLTVRERGQADEELGIGSPARPAALIDQLQRAAWLWGRNRPDELATYRASLGESRWLALRTLGQAVAECLPDGDEDRRLINGLLSSTVMASATPRAEPVLQPRLDL